MRHRPRRTGWNRSDERLPGWFCHLGFLSPCPTAIVFSRYHLGSLAQSSSRPGGVSLVQHPGVTEHIRTQITAHPVEVRGVNLAGLSQLIAIPLIDWRAWRLQVGVVGLRTARANLSAECHQCVLNTDREHTHDLLYPSNFNKSTIHVIKSHDVRFLRYSRPAGGIFHSSHSFTAMRLFHCIALHYHHEAWQETGPRRLVRPLIPTLLPGLGSLCPLQVRFTWADWDNGTVHTTCLKSPSERTSTMQQRSYFDAVQFPDGWSEGHQLGA
ncbi:hypothetical protein F4780DRAFT_203868 [Xylariomycetidae sp. FL0641]|nr:hypothetical protein F4780DRAFT_203868 [Xylariomycetidae sp. FL0641]